MRPQEEVANMHDKICEGICHTKKKKSKKAKAKAKKGKVMKQRQH